MDVNVTRRLNPMSNVQRHEFMAAAGLIASTAALAGAGRVAAEDTTFRPEKPVLAAAMYGCKSTIDLSFEDRHDE
jgi:hypothetical protein